jgi:hypothetical protein
MHWEKGTRENNVYNQVRNYRNNTIKVAERWLHKRGGCTNKVAAQIKVAARNKVAVPNGKVDIPGPFLHSLPSCSICRWKELQTNTIFPSAHLSHPRVQSLAIMLLSNSVYLNKAVAGAGRPPSLLAVATPHFHYYSISLVSILCDTYFVHSIFSTRCLLEKAWRQAESTGLDNVGWW